MYPTSNSSSASQSTRDPNIINHNINNGGGSGSAGTGAGGTGLARYRSAPVSFLANTVDSVINNGQNQQHNVGNHIVSGGGTPTPFFSPQDTQQMTSFRLNEFATAFNGLKSQSPAPLFRHGSSPAGFLNTLVSNSTPTDGRGSRLNSQLSFTGTSSYSQISEESDMASSLVFSSSSHNKRYKNDINGLNIMEYELNFGLSESGPEAGTMEKMMDLPHDSVPCKIRAKRGCATHPRSIAERERRTRISGKLKKLQDLVPNMDKQTSYSDMLDLAVQHIKGLQSHVQSLHKELQNCSCGCRLN